ncbi:type II toxin-antitoxin system Phd/YefM family antitoxin [Propionibacterium freudenreichii]|nr:type II toxin-antitoxin system Phd/YefM family antitoxin [Propionibacterium freudenreichii]MCT2992604.1 type II toxin-antitoxin system Phd/YefM family antitoxin [Propionibacterium freudenreichii]
MRTPHPFFTWCRDGTAPNGHGGVRFEPKDTISAKHAPECVTNGRPQGTGWTSAAYAMDRMSVTYALPEGMNAPGSGLPARSGSCPGARTKRAAGDKLGRRRQAGPSPGAHTGWRCDRMWTTPRVHPQTARAARIRDVPTHTVGMPVTVRNITTREFRDNLSEQLSRAAYSGDRIQILRNGQPIAMVVSMDDAEELRELDYYKDAADYRRAVAERNGDPLAMPTRNDVIVADGASARNDLARRLGFE